MQPSPDALGPASPHDAVGQLLRMLAMLRRRWLVWLAATALGLAAAALALRSLPPRYHASATLVLHQGGPRVLDKVRGVAEEGATEGKGYEAYYQTQRAILGSRAVATRALERLGLADDPEALREADGPLHRAPESADAVERLGRLISIREVRGSRVIEIVAEHPDPERARDLANALADAYLAHVHGSRRSLGQQAEDDLAKEREAAQVQLLRAEAALAAFKDEHSITSISLSDRQNVITQDVLTLSARSKEAEAEHIHLSGLLQQAERHHQAGDPLAALLLLADGEPALERLRAEHVEAKAAFRAADIELGPKHAEHRRAAQRVAEASRDLEREVLARLASLRSRAAVSRRTEQRLGSALAREHGRALALGGLEQRHHALARDARTAEEEFLLIARRDTEVSLTNRLEVEGIEPLDRATTPATPAFPHRGVALALGATLGLGLGFILALVIDARDQRIRDVADLERALGEHPVAVLGQLPALRGEAGLRRGDAREQRRARDLYVHRFPGSLTAERCRGVRTSLAFVHGAAGRRCIMVSSPGPAEGKSSVATSLALSLCQADKRVVLIDADLRRPRLHEVFGLESDTHGLSTFLQGQSTLDDILVHAPAGAPGNLDIIPCGAAPERPAELLESPALARLLEQLRERYDMVIIDTPPVLPVADPLLVARVVDGVVLVPRVGHTTRGQLMHTVGLLRRANAQLLGLVLNEVDERRSNDYGGAGYGYRSQGEPASSRGA